jgi:hypothetical protein
MKSMATFTNTTYGYFPDFIVTPGAVLQETIDSLGMSQAGLATRTGLSRKKVNQIRARSPSATRRPSVWSV